MRELRTSNAHRLANVGLGMGLGMGLGLGSEVIFYRRSSPFESLDVTRTHLEVKRLGKNDPKWDFGGPTILFVKDELVVGRIASSVQAR
jgi:hypothetical protein